MAMSASGTFSTAGMHVASTEAIAREREAPLAEAAKLFDEEFASLAAEARITQFLGVLTTRRVRIRLREG